MHWLSPFFYMKGKYASSDRRIEMGDIICDEICQKNSGIDTFWLQKRKKKFWSTMKLQSEMCCVLLYHELWSEVCYRCVQCCSMSYDLNYCTDVLSAVPWVFSWEILQMCSALYHELWSELCYRPVKCSTMSYDLSYLTEVFSALPWVMT